jgi:hypothetical protein
LVVDHTFHFNHVGLVLCFLVVQGCINPWYISSHVLYCFCSLYIVNNPTSFTSVRTISKPMVSFTTPTLHRWLSWPLNPCVNHSGFFMHLFPLWIIFEESWLSSLLPLIHLEFFIVFPSLLESWPCFQLII